MRALMMIIFDPIPKHQFPSLHPVHTFHIQSRQGTAGKVWAEYVQEFEESEKHYNCTIHIHLHARTLSIANN